MLVRRTATALAIAGLTGMGITAFATPVLAVEVVNCANPVTTIQLEGNGPWAFDTTATCQPNPEISIAQTDAGLVGDVTVFSDVGVGGFSSDITDDANGVGSTWALTVNGSEVTYTGGATSGTIIVEFRDINATIGQTFEITLGGGGGDTPSGDSGSTDALSGPAPRIQQFPLPVTGTCDEAQPEGLNWGGVASGGWNESWSWWMNDGEGGHVCTRTLIYNTSMAVWQVD